MRVVPVIRRALGAEIIEETVWDIGGLREEVDSILSEIDCQRFERERISEPSAVDGLSRTSLNSSRRSRYVHVARSARRALGADIIEETVWNNWEIYQESDCKSAAS